MKFPDVERVIYQKNPLVEVVCQCVFSRIFAIDERVPAAPFVCLCACFCVGFLLRRFMPFA